MDLSSIPLFGLIKQKMSWLNQRQQVIAQNVANADTPDHMSRDLKPINFRNIIRDAKSHSHGVSMIATQPNHISGNSVSSGTGFRETDVRRPYETSPDGNQVVLEEQMIKMNETTTNHNLITQIYKKQLAMFKSVTRTGG